MRAPPRLCAAAAATEPQPTLAGLLVALPERVRPLLSGPVHKECD
jgi:hypothetical protein